MAASKKTIKKYLFVQIKKKSKLLCLLEKHSAS